MHFSIERAFVPFGKEKRGVYLSLWRFLAQFWKDFYRRMGVVGLEPTETEVEGFTVGKNPTDLNEYQYLSIIKPVAYERKNANIY
jgi:hypothetical protein